MDRVNKARIFKRKLDDLMLLNRDNKGATISISSEILTHDFRDLSIQKGMSGESFKAGVSYKKGDIVYFGGDEYIVDIPHLSDNLRTPNMDQITFLCRKVTKEAD